MPYFKDKLNKLHFLESTDDAHLLPEECILISDAEAFAILHPTVDQVKTGCLAAINARAAMLLSELSAAYPDVEVQSWAQQTREAEALAVDSSASTPLLSAIAAARGLTIDGLAERVRAKVAAYAAASGTVIGQRQALEDALMSVDLAAPDAAAQLEAIQWPAA